MCFTNCVKKCFKLYKLVLDGALVFISNVKKNPLWEALPSIRIQQ